MRYSFILIFLTSAGFTFSNPADWSMEEKEEVIRKVYDKVYEALGNSREAPKLKIINAHPVNIAFMRKGQNDFPIIGFETQAFDVCAQFGDRMEDALAFLLGHEICHYYFNHNWGADFSSTYSLSFLDEITSTLAESVAHDETEADVKGGMLCYLAGYRTDGIAEPLLRALYKEYNLQPSPKYPSLEERIAIAKKRDSLIADYIKVFETGNFSMMVADYKLAAKCFEFILGKGFHHSAIYNNLGVSYYLQGVKEVSPKRVKFFYPVELDLSSMQSEMGSRGNTELFKKALKSFKSATDFNSEYATGFLNMACMHMILEEQSMAIGFAEKAMGIASNTGDVYTLKNARMLLALVDAVTPDTGLSKNELKLQKKGKYLDKGVRELNKLIAEGHYLSKINLEVINAGESFDYSKSRQHPLRYNEPTGNIVAGTNTVEKVSPFTSYSKRELNDNVENSQTIKIDEEKLLTANLGETIIYLFKSTSDRPIYYVFHKVNSASEETTVKGLKIGATEQEVLSAYGTPNTIMPASNRTVLCYKDAKLLVFLDSNNQMQEWAVWRKL